MVLATFIAGCGGGDGRASCGQVQPCGGDIKGNWTVVESCLNTASLTTQLLPVANTLCPSATVESADLSATGTFAFNADMTYAADSTTTGTVQLNVPQSCVMGLSCPLVTAAIQFQLLLNPVPAVQAVTCAGTAGCVCTVTLAPLRLGGAGTYALNGNVVSTFPATTTGRIESREYCVAGSRLHFMTVERTSTTPPGQGTITGGLVAEKR